MSVRDKDSLKELLSPVVSVRIGRWERVVLLKQVHHTLGPVCHIFADQEGEVTSVHILPVHKRLWLESVSDPESVLHVSDRIVDASENGNWYS